MLIKGSFAFLSLTRTTYSDLPLISKPTQIFPSAVMCTYRNDLPCHYRPVKELWPFLGRFLDIFAPLWLSHLHARPFLTNKRKTSFSTLYLTCTWTPPKIIEIKNIIHTIIKFNKNIIGISSNNMFVKLHKYVLPIIIKLHNNAVINNVL